MAVLVGSGKNFLRSLLFYWSHKTIIPRGSDNVLRVGKQQDTAYLLATRKAMPLQAAVCTSEPTFILSPSRCRHGDHLLMVVVEFWCFGQFWCWWRLRRILGKWRPNLVHFPKATRDENHDLWNLTVVLLLQVDDMLLIITRIRTQPGNTGNIFLIQCWNRSRSCRNNVTSLPIDFWIGNAILGENYYIMLRSQYQKSPPIL